MSRSFSRLLKKLFAVGFLTVETPAGFDTPASIHKQVRAPVGGDVVVALDESDERRAFRSLQQLHPRFFKGAVTLLVVAFGAGADQVLPGV